MSWSWVESRAGLSQGESEWAEWKGAASILSFTRTGKQLIYVGRLQKGTKQVIKSYITAISPPRPGTEHHSSSSTIASELKGRKVRSIIVVRSFGPWVVVSKRVQRG